jgi:hypothetical protein
MRAAHEHRTAHLQMPEEGGQVIGFRVPACGRWRTPVTTAVVSNRMELFAQTWPNIIPHGGMHNSIVQQHESLVTRSTFFVIDFAILDIQVTSQGVSGLRFCRSKRACQNSAGHQCDSCNHPKT